MTRSMIDATTTATTTTTTTTTTATKQQPQQPQQQQQQQQQPQQPQQPQQQQPYRVDVLSARFVGSDVDLPACILLDCAVLCDIAVMTAVGGWQVLTVVGGRGSCGLVALACHTQLRKKNNDVFHTICLE